MNDNNDDKPKEPKSIYTAKTEAELEQLAWDVIGGRVWGTWSAPDAHISFMILGLLAGEQADQMKAAKIMHVYEYLDKAGPRSVNNMPMFMSMNMIDEHDGEILITKIKEIEALKKARMPNTPDTKGGNSGE